MKELTSNETQIVNGGLLSYADQILLVIAAPYVAAAFVVGAVGCFAGMKAYHYFTEE